MAKQKAVRNSNGRPATKTAAIREAVKALGGLDSAETGRTVQYVKKQWHMDVKSADVSQWKSNERRRLREAGAPPAVERSAPAPAPAAARPAASEEGMSLADLDTLAGLVHRYGVASVRRVLKAFFGAE